MVKQLPDNIEEYFKEVEGSRSNIISRELFTGNQDVDLKTDLQARELTLINALLHNDVFLKTKGLKPAFSKYLIQYMRLKYSLDRKSRGEFVNVNKVGDDISKASELASNIHNIGLKK